MEKFHKVEPKTVSLAIVLFERLFYAHRLKDRTRERTFG
jgi:hypothetical protein